MELKDYGMSRERGFLSHYEIDEIALPALFKTSGRFAETNEFRLTNGIWLLLLNRYIFCPTLE